MHLLISFYAFCKLQIFKDFFYSDDILCEKYIKINSFVSGQIFRVIQINLSLIL